MPQETAYSAQPTTAQAISGITAQPLEIPAPPSDPDNPPWGFLSALLTWVTSVGLMFLIPNLCVLPYIAYYYGNAPDISRETLLADKTLILISVCALLPVHLLTLLLIWAVTTKMGKFSPKKVLGWSWSPSFRIGKSIVLAILLLLVAWLITGLFGAKETEVDRILRSSRAAALALAFLAVVTAPLVEELVYRGLLYSALQRVIGRWFAVMAVTALFAGLHVVQYWPNFGAISAITLLSLVLTVIRARTGRLLPCFMVHLVFNGVQSLIIVFEPYLRTLFSQKASGVLTCVWCYFS